MENPGLDDISVRPLIGWKTVIDTNSREIRMQLTILFVGLPLRRRFPFSDVVRAEQVCKDVTVEEYVGQGSRKHEGFQYDVLVTLRGGRTITLPGIPATYDDYAPPGNLVDRVKDFVVALRQLFGLPLDGSLADLRTPSAQKDRNMCRYHPELLADCECVDCHKRFCSKCVKEVEGQ